MPRQEIITKSWESKGVLRNTKHTRTYRVTYIDDSPERSEAIEFFGNGLFPSLDLPGSVDRMTEAEAQVYLDSHPLQKKYQMLTLDPRSSLVDEDLHRLQFFPELERLHSHAPNLTDSGVAFIQQLPELRHLLVYSPHVTDGCLEFLATLRQLQTLDLQGSHQISSPAFEALVAGLPDLVDIYPPFARPLSEVLAAAQKSTQNPKDSFGR